MTAHERVAACMSDEGEFGAHSWLLTQNYTNGVDIVHYTCMRCGAQKDVSQARKKYQWPYKNRQRVPPA